MNFCGKLTYEMYSLVKCFPRKSCFNSLLQYVCMDPNKKTIAVVTLKSTSHPKQHVNSVIAHIYIDGGPRNPKHSLPRPHGMSTRLVCYNRHVPCNKSPPPLLQTTLHHVLRRRQILGFTTALAQLWISFRLLRATHKEKVTSGYIFGGYLLYNI